MSYSAPILALEHELRERWPHRRFRVLPDPVLERVMRRGLRELVAGIRLLRAAEHYACARGFHHWTERHGLDWCSLCGRLRDRALRMDTPDMDEIEDGNAPAEVGS